MARKEREGLYDVVIISSMDIPEYVDLFRAKGEVAAFMGSPGLGKTSAIYWAAKGQADDLGLKFIENPTPEDWKTPGNYCYATTLSSQLDETDTKGVPHIVTLSDNTQITVFTPTELFPQHGVGMIVLDEFPNGRSQVQNAMQQMILDHKAGNYNISKDIQFVIAGNKPSDNCGVYNIPQALRNRIGWFEISRPSVEQWLQKMEDIGQPINPVMAAWMLSIGNKYFDNLGAAAEQYAYGSPRSITKASKMIEGVNDNKMIAKLVGSFIGNAAGQELVSFLELTKQVDINALLKTPADIHQYEQNPGLLYSVSLSLIDRCVETPALTENVLAILLETKKNEYGVFIMKGLMTKWGKGKTLERIGKCKNAVETMQKYHKILKADASAK